MTTPVTAAATGDGAGQLPGEGGVPSSGCTPPEGYGFDPATGVLVPTVAP